MKRTRLQFTLLSLLFVLQGVVGVAQEQVLSKAEAIAQTLENNYNI
ncbi:MAG TPA: transporter, partial [Leeuwenhoekiella sp.]|nr:transporter [Leeuwenhoekiella sp.]